MEEGNVQFDEEQNLLYSRVERSSKTPKLVQFIIDRGIVGDEKSATYILLGAALVIVVVSIIVFVVASDGGRAEIVNSPDDHFPTGNE